MYEIEFIRISVFVSFNPVAALPTVNNMTICTCLLHLKINNKKENLINHARIKTDLTLILYKNTVKSLIKRPLKYRHQKSGGKNPEICHLIKILFLQNCVVLMVFVGFIKFITFIIVFSCQITTYSCY